MVGHRAIALMAIAATALLLSLSWAASQTGWLMPKTGEWGQTLRKLKAKLAVKQEERQESQRVGTEFIAKPRRVSQESEAALPEEWTQRLGELQEELDEFKKKLELTPKEKKKLEELKLDELTLEGKMEELKKLGKLLEKLSLEHEVENFQKMAQKKEHKMQKSWGRLHKKPKEKTEHEEEEERWQKKVEESGKELQPKLEKLRNRVAKLEEESQKQQEEEPAQP